MAKPKFNQVAKLYGGYWRYDFLDFHYLINEYFPPPAFVKILQKELPRLINQYPSCQKIIAELLAKWQKKDYFCPENLIVGNGSSELIRVLNGMIAKITVPIPTFNEYLALPKQKIRLFPMSEKEHFKLDAEALIRAIKKSKSEYTVINNPNNPTGNLTSRKDIEKILQTGTKTIVDEAFIDYAPEASVENLIAQYPNLIVIKSLTKTMGAAGLRLGYLLTANREIKKAVSAALPIWNINSLAEKFIELFPIFKKEYKQAIEKTIREREFLFRALQKIDYLEPFPSQANFIFCKTKKDGCEIMENLYEKHKILIKGGIKQQTLRNRFYLRVGVRKRQDNLKLLAALREEIN